MKRRIFIVLALVLFAGPFVMSIHAAERHPFGFEGRAALRSAHPAAVTPDGLTILYEVNFGGLKGPTNSEWRLIGADGSNERQLTLPDHFAPLGFMKDKDLLFGILRIERKGQLAIVPQATGKPTIIITLPSGIR